MVSFATRASARLADAVRAAGAGGITGGLAESVAVLLDGSAPPPAPPGIITLPWYGQQRFETEDDLVAFAELLWDEHQPDHDYHLRLTPPFVARDNDRCCVGRYCRGHVHWPCVPAQWAATALVEHRRVPA